MAIHRVFAILFVVLASAEDIPAPGPEVCVGGGSCSPAASPSLSAVGREFELELRENGSSEIGKLYKFVCPENATHLSIGEVATGRKGGWRLFSGGARRLDSCEDLSSPDVNGLAYMVPPINGDKGPGSFVFPSVRLGHRVTVPHVEVKGAPGPITVTTVGMKARVFVVENFFTREEALALKEHAESIKDPTNKLKRSSTGAQGYSVSDTRTSDNAWDTGSPTAIALKKRIMTMIGMGNDYKDEWLDGLQTLRYNFGTAYNTHFDYLENAPNHNANPWEGGSNRFATLLLYLNDVESGGETVFPHAPRVSYDSETGHVELVDTVSAEEAIKQLTDVEEVEAMSKEPLSIQHSWQRKLVGQCRTKLAVQPRLGRAVLFYSQTPEGHRDEMSEHGACPVLRGQKWAANLWVWNACRLGFACAPGYDEKVAAAKKQQDPSSVHAVISNGDVPDAELYWENNFSSDFPIGKQVGMNTFAGHRWFVKSKSTNRFIHGPWVVPNGVKEWRPVLLHRQLECSEPSMCQT